MAPGQGECSIGVKKWFLDEGVSFVSVEGGGKGGHSSVPLATKVFSVGQSPTTLPCRSPTPGNLRDPDMLERVVVGHLFQVGGNTDSSLLSCEREKWLLEMMLKSIKHTHDSCQ